MRIYKFALCLAMTIGILKTSYAEEITFMTHNIEGETYWNDFGELRGLEHMGRCSFQLELVREMRIQMKHEKITYEIVPFNRGKKIIEQNKKSYAFFNIGVKPERKKNMKFVSPLTLGTVYAYELKSTPTGVKTMADAKKHHICVLRGGSQDEYVRKNEFPFVSRNDYQACFKMLIKGRVSLASVANLDFLGVLKTAGISPDLIQATPYVLYRSIGGLAFSNRVPDHVIKEWQAILDKIKASGKYSELEKKYLYP